MHSQMIRSPAASKPEPGPRASVGEARTRRQASARDRARLREHHEAVRRVEGDLERQTNELRELEKVLANPSFYSDGGEDVGAAVRRHGELRASIAMLEVEWARAAEKLSALDRSSTDA